MSSKFESILDEINCYNNSKSIGNTKEFLIAYPISLYTDSTDSTKLKFEELVKTQIKLCQGVTGRRGYLSSMLTVDSDTFMPVLSVYTEVE